jgi:hypothetical protein
LRSSALICKSLKRHSPHNALKCHGGGKPMSTTWPTSPVTEAIAKVLEVLNPAKVALRIPESGKQYLVVSYREDFNFIWSLLNEEVENGSSAHDEDAPLNPAHSDTQYTGNTTNRVSSYGDLVNWLSCRDAAAPGGKCLVLVWDGTPEPEVVGNVRLAEYTTPYDWAVALSLILDQRKDIPAREGKAGLQIAIIDVASESGSSPEALRLLLQGSSGLLSLSQRIQWYRAIVAYPGDRYLYDVVLDLCRFSTDPSTAPKDAKGTRVEASWEGLRHLWASRLSAPANPRDRHAIANLVGPQLLISAMGFGSTRVPSVSAPGLSALVTLMKVLRLIPGSQKQVRAPWITGELSLPDAEDGAPTFVLVDDLHELGWAEFIRLALGLPKTGASLVALDKPDGLGFGPEGNKSLLDLLMDENGLLRVKKGIALVPGAKNPILFLDLRLFNTRAVRDEISFFRHLLDLARQARDDHGTRGDLPWRGFGEDELTAVERCIAREQVEGDEYFIALTLLPRLIALVDPMVPVILFSSTGQRRIAQALNGYESIITDFDKPRFFGAAGDDVTGMTRVHFETALARARSLLRGRHVCQWIQRTGQRKSDVGGESYVEVYIDESGEISSPAFRTGGLAIIYEDEDTADRFNKEMVNSALIWGPTDVEPNPSTIAFRKEGLSWAYYESRVYSPVSRILKDSHVRDTIGFCLTCPSTPLWRNSSELTSPWCLDNIYRALVLQTLEVLLFEVIPQRLGQERPRFKCSVHVATRIRRRSDADTDSDWTEFVRRYGVQMIENEGAFLSVTPDSVYPMAGQLLALYPNVELKVVGARGARLSYGSPPTKPPARSLPRPAHFLADLVVRFSNNDRALKVQPSLRTWLDVGFNAVADAAFVKLLEACRDSRHGRHVEALLGTYNAGRLATDSNLWAKDRLSMSVQALSGREFTEFSDRLAINNAGTVI